MSTLVSGNKSDLASKKRKKNGEGGGGGMGGAIYEWASQSQGVPVGQQVNKFDLGWYFCIEP